MGYPILGLMPHACHGMRAIAVDAAAHAARSPCGPCLPLSSICGTDRTCSLSASATPPSPMSMQPNTHCMRYDSLDQAQGRREVGTTPPNPDDATVSAVCIAGHGRKLMVVLFVSFRPVNVFPDTDTRPLGHTPARSCPLLYALAAPPPARAQE